MFKWKDEYSVGVEKIDKQHMKLFELGRKLYDIIKFDDGYDHFDEIMNILEELKLYTYYHFESEEELLKKYNYEPSKFNVHRMQHKAFIDKIASIDEESIDFQQEKSVLDILEFIERWISEHILRADMIYKNFFKENGVK